MEHHGGMWDTIGSMGDTIEDMWDTMTGIAIRGTKIKKVIENEPPKLNGGILIQNTI